MESFLLFCLFVFVVVFVLLLLFLFVFLQQAITFMFEIIVSDSHVRKNACVSSILHIWSNMQFQYFLY